MLIFGHNFIPSESLYPGLHDREAAGDEGVAGHDDFITRADPESAQGDVQRRGAAVGHDGVCVAVPGGPLFPERLHVRAAGELASAERAQHHLLVGRVDGRPVLHQSWRDRGTPAENCQIVRGHGHGSTPCVGSIALFRGMDCPSNYRVGVACHNVKFLRFHADYCVFQ